MNKFGWHGCGLGKYEQGTVELKLPKKDLSIDPPTLNIRYIYKCAGCGLFGDKFVHFVCKQCGLIFNNFIKFQKESQIFNDSGLIFNDFIKFRKESQIFDTTKQKSKPSHIEPIEKEKPTELEKQEVTEPESDSSESHIDCTTCFAKFKENFCYCPAAVEKQNGTELESDSSDSDPIENKHPESETDCSQIECMRCYEIHKSKYCTSYFCPGDTRVWVAKHLENGKKVWVCKKHIEECHDEVIFLGRFEKVKIECADDITLLGYFRNSQSGAKDDAIFID